MVRVFLHIAYGCLRCDLEHLTPIRLLHRPSPPKQNREFYETLRRLTPSPVQRYISGEKNRWFKFPLHTNTVEN